MGRIVSHHILPASHALEVVRITGKLGDTDDLIVPADVAEEDRAQVTVFVRGSVSTNRKTGNPTGPGNHVRHAGEFSFEGYPYRVIQKGTFLIRVESEDALYYCVSHRNKAKIACRAIRLKAGESFAAPQWSFVFIASGSCQLAGPEKVIDVISGTTEIRAVTDLLGVLIRC